MLPFRVQRAAPSSIRRAIALLALGALLVCALATAAPADHLQGVWRPLQPGDRADTVLAQARHGELDRFDVNHVQTLGMDGRGAWIVLFPDAHAFASGTPLTLSIRSAPYASFTRFTSDGIPQVTDSLNDFGDHRQGYGRIVFDLPADRAPGAPILLRLNPSAYPPGPISFQLQPTGAFMHANALWLAALGACFGIMLAMAAMGLFFGAILRDSTFFWYAGYIIAYAAVQGVMTGFLFHPLGLHALAGLEPLLVSGALSLATPCATMFLIRFCDFRTYAPLLRLALLTMTIAMVGVAVLRPIPLLPVPLHAALESLVNPLLILGTVTMLVGALVAGARGSRAAWFFLAGWTPLLMLTAMASAQASGAFPDLPWLADASVPAGALEAVVLSAGLADRALNFRRDRDQARALADRDPLTGVLNRRGWTEAAMTRLMHAAQRPQSLLFLDLDHFKTLNDQFGHSAGDQALVAVTDALTIDLRPTDILGRYGGEELVVFLDESSPVDAMHIAVRLRRRVHRLEIPIDHEEHVLTVSIGVAHARPDDTISQLIDRADHAMYAAKERGRNQVVAEHDITPRRSRPQLRAVHADEPARERGAVLRPATHDGTHYTDNDGDGER